MEFKVLKMKNKWCNIKPQYALKATTNATLYTIRNNNG